MPANTSDKGLGIGLVCGGIAALGALYALVTGTAGVAASNGFAVAVVFGALAVASIHAFGE